LIGWALAPRLVKFGLRAEGEMETSVQNRFLRFAMLHIATVEMTMSDTLSAHSTRSAQTLPNGLGMASGASRAFVVYEAFQFAGADGVLELSDCFCLDLADSLAGDFEDSADFLQRVGVAVADSVSQLDDLALAI